MEREFKILAIDGGGIKGLYSACVIKQIEERYNCKIGDHFDMICGTSTGGLIALALSLGYSAEEVVDFYKEKGTKIFPYTNRVSRFIGFLRQTFWFGKYKNKELRKCLVEFFGNKVRMKDTNNLLCIPSFNLTKGEPIVFKNPQHGDFHRDREFKVVDVALATSAAPTYFPIVEMDYPNFKGTLVDGGVWANNPTLCGILEALEHFVGEGKEFSTYSVLSIASITQSNGWRMDKRKRRSFMGWRGNLFQLSLDGQNFFTDFFSEKIVNCTSPKGSYERIPSVQLSKDQLVDIEMDKAGNKSLKLLESLGNQQGIDYTTKPKFKSKIDAFFKAEKLFNCK